MAVPFFDLARKLNEEGIELTYADVLLVRDYFEKPETTPHMRAALKHASIWGIAARIVEVLHAERRRREMVNASNP